jgi:hypothetical protein
MEKRKIPPLPEVELLPQAIELIGNHYTYCAIPDLLLVHSKANLIRLKTGCSGRLLRVELK